MFYLIMLLFLILLLLLISFFTYAIKYIKGINDESVKSPFVAYYYDRICLLGMAIVFLIVLIGVLLGGK